MPLIFFGDNNIKENKPNKLIKMNFDIGKKIWKECYKNFLIIEQKDMSTIDFMYIQYILVYKYPEKANNLSKNILASSVSAFDHAKS